MQKIKLSKASGTDKIPDRLLKDSATVVAHYLKIIFNVSLSEGIFPNDWKRLPECPQFTNLERKMNATTIVQYQPFLQFLEFSKNFYMNKLINTFLKIISLLHINQDSEVAILYLFIITKNH